MSNIRAAIEALATASGVVDPSSDNIVEAISKLPAIPGTAEIQAVIEDELEAEGLIATAIAAAIPQSEAVADSVATTAEGLVTDFNALLAKLRTAGIIAASE